MLATGADWTYAVSGPKVASSRPAGNPPAPMGPETNSQKGAKSVNAARSGA